MGRRPRYRITVPNPEVQADLIRRVTAESVHEAVQAMARGEIELVLVGVVNALLIPEPFVVMCKARMLAEDGHCKSFDAAADGYARGEGAGVLVLKSLADASRDHDRIYAVTGVNQDGRTHVHKRDPVGQHGERAGCGGVGGRRRPGGGQLAEHHVVRRGGTDVNTDRLTGDSAGHPGIVHRFLGDLQQQPLLRVHDRGFAR